MSERITRVSLAEAVKGDRTDWDRLRSITDDELEAAIAEDADARFVADEKSERSHYIIFRASDGEWRWRLLGPDGRAMADSPRGYSNRNEVDRAIGALRKALADTDAKAA